MKYINQTKFRLFQLALGLDQFLNVFISLVIGDGWADEAFSSRCWRMKDKGWSWQYKAVNKLFFWQHNHCESSYESEKLRRQLPPEYRS